MTARRAKTARRAPEGAEPLRVAVCIDSRDGPGRERLLAVYRYATEKNWRLFLVRREDAEAMEHLASLRLDGAILYDRETRLHRFLKKRGIVCVEAGTRNLGLDDAAAFSDSPAICRLAVEHLAAAGVRSFGYCGLATTASSRLRVEGFSRSVRERGSRASIFSETLADGEAKLSSLIQWLQELPKPAGILAYDDKLAERVLAGCRWAGLEVPGEVAVVGIGNDELICELAYPRLTSVALPTQEIGRRAAQLLETLLQGRRCAKRHWPMAPLEVVVRASTDRTPSAPPKIMAAIEFLRAQSHRPVGTDQVAAAVGLPRRTLERHFQAALGQTIHEFLVELRLRQAKQRLRQSDVSLSEIARQCGYSALSAFTRMFAAQAKCHPETYRRQYRNERSVAASP